MEMINFIADNPCVFYTIVAWLSLCIGSFLNVVIHRLPKILFNQWSQESHAFLYPNKSTPDIPKYTLSKPRSHCPKCDIQLRWYHNIPLISWVVLKGKCASCKTPISARYPFVELLTMVLSVAIAWKFGFTFTTLFAIIFTQITIALFFIDWDHMILPDRLVFPLIGLGLLVNTQSTFASPVFSIYGAVFGFMSLWSIYIIMKAITGREGMGYGDFKYLAAIGAWFGPLVLPKIFMISALSGLAFVVVAFIIGKIRKKDKEQNTEGADQNFKIPFGPHLAIAALITLFTL